MSEFARHEDVVRIHEMLVSFGSEEVPDPASSWVALESRLPSRRARLGESIASWIRRPLLVAFVGTTLGTGAAYAAGLEPHRGIVHVWMRVTGNGDEANIGTVSTRIQGAHDVHRSATMEQSSDGVGSGESPVHTVRSVTEPRNASQDNSAVADHSRSKDDNSGGGSGDDEPDDDNSGSGSGDGDEDDNSGSGSGDGDEPDDDNSGPGSGDDEAHDDNSGPGSGDDDDDDDDDDDGGGSGSSSSGSSGSGSTATSEDSSDSSSDDEDEERDALSS